MTLPLPELLAPAGTPDKLRTALRYGADAVYLGGPAPNLRARGSGFDWPSLEQAFALVREQGKRAYLCCNALPHEQSLPEMRQALERLAALPAERAPHALIIADPGVLRLARDIAPWLPIHLSTQANTLNSQSLAFWHEQGVARVNLARELDLKALRLLLRAAEAAGGPEIEVFVHGAQCMAYSGRCLLAAHLNARPANRGECTHPCRYEYRPLALALEERTRPGEPLWELWEDGEYSTLLAAEDLCLLPYVAWLWRNGVTAVKIEGRTRSEGYLAQVTDAYRAALDSLPAKAFSPAVWLEELRTFAGRPLSSGMFLPKARRRHWQSNPGEERPILAKVISDMGGGRWQVAVRSPWDTARDVEVLAPGLRRPVLRAGTYGLENAEGNPLERANPGLEHVLTVMGQPLLEPGWFLRNGKITAPAAEERAVD